MVQIISSGIGSGLDINTIVKDLVASERSATDLRLDTKQAIYQSELSAYQSLKSVLDTFSGKLEDISKTSTLNNRKANSENTDIFTATVDKTANSGSYSVKVEALATHHKIASGPYLNSADTIGTGELTLKSGDNTFFSIDINELNNSVKGIADAINLAEANESIIATIINDSQGAHLVLSAKHTGDKNNISIDVSTDSLDSGNLSALSFNVLESNNGMNEIVSARNAQVNIDGFIQSFSSNRVKDMIQGVELDLLAVNTEQPFLLNIEEDSQFIKNTVRQFVSDYNEVISTINALSSYDKTTGISGVLQGDSTVARLSTSIRQVLSESVLGNRSPIEKLNQWGVKINNVDGKLLIDNDKLSNIPQNASEEIVNTFSSENGIAINMKKLLVPYIEPYGFIENRIEGLTSSIDSVNTSREQLDRRMVSVQSRYQAQFNALDALVGQLNSTGSFLTQQLENLPGFIREK